MAKMLSLGFAGATLILAALCLASTGGRDLYFDAPPAPSLTADMSADSAG